MVINIKIILAILALAAACLLNVAAALSDPTPAQLQAIENDVAALATATSADAAAQAQIASDNAAVAAAQTALTNDTAASATTAAAVQQDITQLTTDVDALNMTPAQKSEFLAKLNPRLGKTVLGIQTVSQCDGKQCRLVPKVVVVQRPALAAVKTSTTTVVSATNAASQAQAGRWQYLQGVRERMSARREVRQARRR